MYKEYNFYSFIIDKNDLSQDMHHTLHVKAELGGRLPLKIALHLHPDNKPG